MAHLNQQPAVARVRVEVPALATRRGIVGAQHLLGDEVEISEAGRQRGHVLRRTAERVGVPKEVRWVQKTSRGDNAYRLTVKTTTRFTFLFGKIKSSDNVDDTQPTLIP